MKFRSNPLPEHAEVPLADDGRLEQLVADWSTRHEKPEDGHNACYVVCTGPWLSDDARNAQAAEVVALVGTIGDVVVGHESVQLHRPNAKTLLGKGKAQAVAKRARAAGANLLVIDAQLTPSQTRNLEDVTGFSICDREAVILNVFAHHAKTPRARMQVELAHLQYLRPRIRGIGLDMDQQTGGMTKARGPGETASELLARKLDGRLGQLRQKLAKLERSSQVQRKRRDRCTRITLVGYTNAGKTSLMNALTEAGLSAADRPFETLDTTSRSLLRRGGEVVLSDTVGFIRNLPSRLLDSFASTLAEVCEADLLVLVVDYSDPEWLMHLQTSVGVLEQLGAGDLPRFYVFNKVDRMLCPDAMDYQAVAAGYPAVAVSTHNAEDMARLKVELIAAARRDHRRVTLWVPYHLGELLASIYARCVVERAEAGERELIVTLVAPGHIVSAIEAELAAAAPASTTRSMSASTLI